MTVTTATRVTVRLTEYGRKVWVEHWARYGLAPLGLKPDGTLEVPLWDLMHAFGPFLYMGAPQIPFVDSTLEFNS